MRAVARVLRCTEGQAYTLVVMLAVAATSALGVPPVLQARTDAPAGAQPGLVAPSPTTQPVPTPAGPSPTDDAPASGTAPAPPFAGSLPLSPPAPTPGPRPAPSPSPSPSPGPRTPTPTTLAVSVPPPGAPEGIAIGAGGDFFVATDNAGERGGDGPSSVFWFSAEGRLKGSLAITGQDEGRTHGLLGLAVDHGGRLLALDAAPPRVLALDVDAGTQQVVAEIPDVAPCFLLSLSGTPGRCEPGIVDHVPLPRDLAVASDGTVFVTDHNQATIWRVGPDDGTVEVWHQSNDYMAAPGLAGIDLAPDGAVVVAFTDPLTGLSGGSIYRIERTVDGSAGSRTTLAQVDVGDRPIGLAVDGEGTIYAALSGVATLLVLDADGSELARHDRSGSEPLAAPMGVAVRSTDVLVADQGAGGATDGVVVGFAVT